MIPRSEQALLPGAGLEAGKIPGHWLLVRPGKRVLRPGGLGLTRGMSEALDIQALDSGKFSEPAVFWCGKPPQCDSILST